MFVFAFLVVFRFEIGKCSEPEPHDNNFDEFKNKNTLSPTDQTKSVLGNFIQSHKIDNWTFKYYYIYNIYN